MTKLVCLKISSLKHAKASLAEGFSVIMQMGDEGAQPTVEATAVLPPALDLWERYQRWQMSYYRLGMPYRLEPKTGYVTNVSVIGDCRELAQVFCDRFNRWFQSTEFQPIREKLLEQLSPTDTIRVVIQTPLMELRRFPWHLLSFFDAYPNAEVALAAPAFEVVNQPSIATGDSIRVLAVLGDATTLDVRQDETLLNTLPHAEVHFLEEPSLVQLNDTLWDEQGWDILFFAGHSLSSPQHSSTSPQPSPCEGEGVRTGGAIAINSSDMLSIDQLKYALTKARERGLSIALFNSCDGLGLADGLAELNIPQIVVMREPIPDEVAHAFLKHFLNAFAAGIPLYLAIREARERLQGMENTYPCATWLPVLCQNPAAIPPTWQQLLHQRHPPVSSADSGVVDPSPFPTPAVASSPRLFLTPARFSRSRILPALFASVSIAAVVVGVRFLGGLQAWEWQGYDWLLRGRSLEQTDRRIVVVEVGPEYVEQSVTLSNDALNELLLALEFYQPKLIGLDLYRDFSVRQDHAELANRLETTENLISICKGSDEAIAIRGIAPSPDIPAAQIGFSDFLLDPDGVLRRQLMVMTPEVDSPCQADYAFSSQLALRYLVEEGHSEEFWTEAGQLQMGDTILPALSSRNGLYQVMDAAGYQILLNYRNVPSPQQTVETVLLQEILDRTLSADALVDKIVLVGRTDNDAGDRFLIPRQSSGASNTRGTRAMVPGVMVHAEMISNLLSIAHGDRPPLKLWSERRNIGWIILWSFVAGAVPLVRPAYRTGTFASQTFASPTLASSTLADGEVETFRHKPNALPNSSPNIKTVIPVVLEVALTEVALVGTCWLFLVHAGYWVPLVSPAIAIVMIIPIVDVQIMQARKEKNG